VTVNNVISKDTVTHFITCVFIYPFSVPEIKFEAKLGISGLPKEGNKSHCLPHPAVQHYLAGLCSGYYVIGLMIFLIRALKFNIKFLNMPFIVRVTYLKLCDAPCSII